MAQQTKIPVDWSIRNLDTDELITPQFPIGDEGVAVSVGAQLSDQGRFGLQDPITQWIGGKARSFAFEAVLFSRHVEEAPDVEEQLAKLIGLSEKDEALGRIPICLFRYGSWLSETVLVENVDPKILSVESSTGLPREVRCTITLRRYVPFSQKSVDPTKPTKESFFKVASAAERSYEAMARRFYGDPLLGDRLRKRNPDQPLAPRIGTVIHIPPKSVVLKEPVEPAFHALSLTDEDAVSNYLAILENRNARKLVEVR